MPLSHSRLCPAPSPALRTQQPSLRAFGGKWENEWRDGLSSKTRKGISFQCASLVQAARGQEGQYNVLRLAVSTKCSVWHNRYPSPVIPVCNLGQQEASNPHPLLPAGPVRPRDAWDLPWGSGPGVSESLCPVAQGMLETQQGRLSRERALPSPELSLWPQAGVRGLSPRPWSLDSGSGPSWKPPPEDSPAGDAWKRTRDSWG